METSKKMVRMTLPADSQMVDIVRYALQGISHSLGFSSDEIDDIKLAAGEACNNAVVHAYPGDSGLLEVSFVILENGLEIRIKDEGESFSAEQVIERASSLHEKSFDELKAGGLGLFLMEQLMDQVTIDSANGTEVILRKFIKSQASAPSPSSQPLERDERRSKV